LRRLLAELVDARSDASCADTGRRATADERHESRVSTDGARLEGVILLGRSVALCVDERALRPRDWDDEGCSNDDG
jgi:hypothetical protein